MFRMFARGAALIFAAAFLACVDPGSVAAATTEELMEATQDALDQGLTDEAITLLKDAARQSPDDPNVHYVLGTTYNAAQQYDRAIPALEKARSLSPDDAAVRLQLALAHLALKQSGPALEQFEWLEEKAPDTPNLGFYLGHLYYEQGEHEKAILKLENAKTSTPKYEQLTAYYLGLAHQSAGNEDVAREAMQRASQYSASTSLAEQAAQRITTEPTVRDGKRFSLDALATIQYDDNVRLAPDQNIGGLRDVKLDSLASVVLVRPNYTFLQEDEWQGNVSYAGLQSWYFDQPKQFDLTNHQLALSFFRTGSADDKVNAGVNVAYDHSLLGGDSFLYRMSAFPFVQYRHDGGKHATTLFAQFQDKNFTSLNASNIAEENRDSDYDMVGISHTIAMNEGRDQLRLGYQHDEDDTVGSNYRYRGDRPNIGYTHTFEDNLSLSLDAFYHERDYALTNTIFGVDRRDQDGVYTARLTKFWPVDGVSAYLDFIHNKNDSTIPLFEYTRNITSLGATYRY